MDICFTGPWGSNRCDAHERTNKTRVLDTKMGVVAIGVRGCNCSSFQKNYHI